MWRSQHVISVNRFGTSKLKEKKIEVQFAEVVNTKITGINRKATLEEKVVK